MSRWHSGPRSWREVDDILSDRMSSNSGDSSSASVYPASSDGACPADPTADATDPPHPTSAQGKARKEPDQGLYEDTIAYAELHAHSHYSFLDGASSPEDMVSQAMRLKLHALALTDHDGFYGLVRFATAARRCGLKTVFGAELTVGTEPGATVAGDLPVPSSPRTGCADPQGEHLLILARSPEGYRSLAATIARAHLAGGQKGSPVYRLKDLAREAQGGNWLILTGCRHGAVSAAAQAHLIHGNLEAAALAAADHINRLLDIFGVGQVVVELVAQGDTLRDELHDALVQGARIVREQRNLGISLLPEVITGNAHYAHPQDRRRADVHSALRAGVPLDQADGYLASGSSHLRSGKEMAELVPRYPHALAESVRIAEKCAMDLRLIAPDLPPFPVPDGHDEASYLRELVYQGASERYGPAPQMHGLLPEPAHNDKAWTQINHELDVIENLNFPGYFLIVHELVKFCRDNDILCQGRGSAANSAVCYALGVTSVDPVKHGLLFERFLAPERDGPPDIDIDIASNRREEVIQYVYARHGRTYAAQVANVITYRSRLAVRDAARVLGYDVGLQDAWSRQLERRFSSLNTAEGIPDEVIAIAQELLHTPRHLGIHSGGMVMCDRPVIEVCPVEWARTEGRTVLQWDKDDCADAGLVKFDLLGLGMLTALDHCLRLVSEHHGEDWSLHSLPQDDPAVYDMLCAGDSVGVFQVESRAQISVLPRMRPRTFYDLVVQVALIRPGPIQGGSVHPYIRRRNGEEDVTYLHPLLEKSLAKTLGVPLFQEQLMQMVVDIADFTPAQADQLRRAIGSKRSTERMLELSDELFAGMARHGIIGEVAQQVHRKLLAFANYGFPESHAFSFAYLVYASSFLKCHYPAAFLAALLRSQPMGFYSPASLVADARRHGVLTLGVDISASETVATLECPPGHTPYRAMDGDGLQVTGETARRGPAVRLGLSSVRGIDSECAERIVDERSVGGHFSSIPDLARRVGLSKGQLEALATAGALDELAGGSRRRALWAAGPAAQERPEWLPGLTVGTDAPTLPGMSDWELSAADAWATGITAREHPMSLLRDELTDHHVVPIANVRKIEPGTRVLVAGLITHRQRPQTASGITFLGLEDESGILNVVCSQGMWRRHRILLRTAPAVIMRGIVENVDGVVSLMSDGARAITSPVPVRSRDFQ
ncbi:error-prone DNA polymerase [Devriesea agamarum]|uniref:error-prone DNA polymerase n=1 Tax=Devriesea agamarum TaxID=472569 RepID=UPI00071E3E68|nr:error-prone DNA polymerase [Devriesea agamarum]